MIVIHNSPIDDPTEQEQDNQLEVTVKKVPQGIRLTSQTKRSRIHL